jgi:transcriptional regulator with XRE-family HTH domain
MSIPERVKEFGIRKLAREVGVHPSHISMIFAGQRTPSVHVLMSISSALSVKLPELAAYLTSLNPMFRQPTEKPAA